MEPDTNTGFLTRYILSIFCFLPSKIESNRRKLFEKIYSVDTYHYQRQEKLHYTYCFAHISILCPKQLWLLFVH